MIFVALAAGAVEIRLWEPFPGFSPLGGAATLIGGWEVLRDAARSLRRLRMTMDLSMTIALLAALSIGDSVTALVILFFVLAAEILEGLTVSWGRGAIKELLDTGPRATTVTRAGWWLIRATVLGRSSKPDLDWNTHFTTLTVFVEAK